MQTLYKDLEADKPVRKQEQKPGREHAIGVMSEMLEGYTTRQLEDMAVRNGVIRGKTVKKLRRREIIEMIASHEYDKMNGRGGRRRVPIS